MLITTRMMGMNYYILCQFIITLLHFLQERILNKLLVVLLAEFC